MELEEIILKVLVIGSARDRLVARLQEEGFDVEVCTEEEFKTRTQPPEIISIFHDDIPTPHLYSARERYQPELTPKRSRGKGKKMKPWDNEWNTTSKYLKSRRKLR
jgi:hypothetical protein